MKNGKLLVIGGVVAVLVICAFLFMGGGSDTPGAGVMANDYEKAQAAMTAGEPEQAIEHLKKYTAENPTDAKGWLLLGDAYKSIETFQYPVGMRYQAFEAYYEGYALGDGDSRRRLIWELSPLVVKELYGEGMQEGVGWLPKAEFSAKVDAALAPFKDDAENKSKSKEEFTKEFTKEFIKWSILGGGAQNGALADTLWFELLTNKEFGQQDETVEDELLIVEMMEFDKTLGYVYMPRSSDSFKLVDKTWSLMSQDGFVGIGLQEKHPRADVIVALQEAVVSGDPIRGYKFDYMKLIDSLNAKKDSLDNMGRVALAYAYLATNDQALIESSSQQIVDLLKDSVKGPYAITSNPAILLSKIEKLPQAELDEIIKAISETTYDGKKTWGDVIDKIDSVKWHDEAAIPQGRFRKSILWLTRGAVLEGTYDGKKVEIYFPLRYNSLKDKWECVTGHGLIVMNQKDYNLATWKGLLPYLEAALEKPDLLEPWAEEILNIKKQ